MFFFFTCKRILRFAASFVLRVAVNQTGQKIRIAVSVDKRFNYQHITFGRYAAQTNFCRSVNMSRLLCTFVRFLGILNEG